MSTILPKGDITINRQEGDDADIVLIVPEILPLTDAIIKFQVWTNPTDGTDRELVFEKDNQEGEEGYVGGITVEEQTITVTMIPEDTKGFSGVQRWECQINEPNSYKVKTIGKGRFNIMFELID